MTGVKPEPQLLEQLLALVSDNLGISGGDEVDISKFLHNLYTQCPNNDDRSLRLERFKNVVILNGGDDFPSRFIEKSFDIIDKLQYSAEAKKGPKVKIEPKEPAVNIEPKVKIEDNVLPHTIKEHVDIKVEPVDTLHDHLAKRELIMKDEETTDEREHITKYEQDIDDTHVQVGLVYKGIVTRLAPYGAFVKLNRHQSGLVHISQIAFSNRNRVNNVTDIVAPNQQVFVKVTDIQVEKRRFNSKEKISLTMRGIDQETGLDKSEELQLEMRQSRLKNVEPRGGEPRGVKRRLTSPERWEIRQLIASGVAKSLDYPELADYEEPKDDIEDDGNAEVQIDVELTHIQPSFLKSKVDNSADLEPVKVMKNPEGSMGRAAMKGSMLAKTYKDEKLRRQKEKEREERKLKAASIDVHDPLSRQQQEIVDGRTEEVVSEWKKSQMTKKISYGKRTNLSIKEQRESLPVYSMRQQLVDAVRDNQFLVIVGETGSGKTTQIVQYLSEEGFNYTGGKKQIIGCTQPRRVAAQSVAKRVAEEVGCKLGEEVGYLIRFDDNTSPSTKIKYMTDGMLQREALTDPYMSKYSVIMLDEAHERTISTDVLFALLKQAALKNPDLKIIVTSATLDSDKFSNYFNKCPVIKIPGRTFPVEILYTREPEMDYLAAALDSVIQIHVSEPQGDILVFLTGQEEIDTSCEALYERMKALGDTVPELIILPVYSALPSEIQSRIFEPTPEHARKVILATNIAETSITIDGIYYVIDPGFVKINAYDSKLGMDSLVVSPISQAQANQRSGRAGRTGPGKCYRLYTESAYKNEMLPNTIPEIQRQNLSRTILMLKAMGIKDPFAFEFMDPPPINTMVLALQELYILNAIDELGELTMLGRKMADFPMDPTLAKTLIISAEYGCSQEILTIVAMLSVPTIFYRPKEKQKLADEKKARFNNVNGDHLTLLGIHKSWELNGYSRSWCQENFVQERSMRRVQEVRKQLISIMKNYKHPILSCGNDYSKIRKTLCAGYFKHAVKRDRSDDGYKTIVEQTSVYMHPSSSLFGKNPEFLIYHTLLLTTKEYMHCVTVIEPQWLIEVAPNFYQKSDPTKLNDRKRGEKIIPLFDKFAKSQDSWRLSAQQEAKKRALSYRE